MPRQNMSEKDRKVRKAAYDKKRHFNNREKINAAKAKYRKTDKGRVTVALQSLYNMLRRQFRMAELRKEINQHKCIVCGNANPSALDFHHRKGVIKCFDISSKILCINKHPWTALVEEAHKCDVMCTVHHREIERAISVEKLLAVASVTMEDVEARVRRLGYFNPLAPTR